MVGLDPTIPADLRGRHARVIEAASSKVSRIMLNSVYGRIKSVHYDIRTLWQNAIAKAWSEACWSSGPALLHSLQRMKEPE
jgi:hypothetical protein